MELNISLLIFKEEDQFSDLSPREHFALWGGLIVEDERDGETKGLFFSLCI